LQHAVAYPHQDFADALELNFYASPCAKADQRVLMIRAKNREERDSWIACLNQAAKLKIDDLWDYDESRPLGRGRYADIFPARRTTDPTPFEHDSSLDSKSSNSKEMVLKPYHTCALKIVNKNEFWRRVVKGRERADTLVRELAVQSTLTAKCTSISTFLQLRGFFETSDNVVLELEVLDGTDLFEHISAQGVLAERDAGRIMHDILVCIDAMNRVGLAHRDVKPANILMSNGKDGTTVKMADFGMSTFVGVDGLVRGRCGTPGYVAPEVLSAGPRSGYCNQVDIFSAGVTLYVMLSGYEPFYGESEKELIEANRLGQIDFPESDWGRISSEALDLLRRMLTVNHKERITASEALRHPWLAQFGKLQTVKPESTIGISDVPDSKCQASRANNEGVCTVM
jgi:serine/threonine protein kinase